MSGFGIITLKLKEMYQMITLGKHTTLCAVEGEWSGLQVLMMSHLLWVIYD
jgi:hypothetical protein